VEFVGLAAMIEEEEVGNFLGRQCRSREAEGKEQGFHI
jgi:hypothetical protein